MARLFRYHRIITHAAEQEEVLRNLLDYCRENRISVLFTVNPYTDIQEETQKQFNYMKAIVATRLSILISCMMSWTLTLHGISTTAAI